MDDATGHIQTIETEDGFGPATPVVKIGITDEEILEMIRGKYLMLGRNNTVLK